MIPPIVDIFVYETKRYLWSGRSYFILLTSTLPMLVFLAFTASNAVIILHLQSLDVLQNILLIGYAFFAYIIAIVVSIVIVSDIVGGETSLEFLVLSTKRINIFLGKFVAILIILFVSEIYALLAFFIVLFAYNIAFPSIPVLIITFATGYLVSLVPVAVALFSSCLTLKLNLSSHTATYITIFIFFVVPSIIYFSLFEVGLFQPEMLDLTIHRYIQVFIIKILDPTSDNVTMAQYLFAQQLIVVLIIGCIILSLILFQTAPIY